MGGSYSVRKNMSDAGDITYDDVLSIEDHNAEARFNALRTERPIFINKKGFGDYEKQREMGKIHRRRSAEFKRRRPDVTLFIDTTNLNHDARILIVRNTVHKLRARLINIDRKIQSRFNHSRDTVERRFLKDIYALIADNNTNKNQSLERIEEFLNVWFAKMEVIDELMAADKNNVVYTGSDEPLRMQMMILAILIVIIAIIAIATTAYKNLAPPQSYYIR